MLEYDFEKSIGYWVASTAHALRKALDVELSKQSITFRQWEVLAWIAAKGEQSQVELAEHLCIEAPTLAGILSRMERDGWLVRYPCPDDRRRKRIRVTERAEDVWNQAVECCLKVRGQAVSGISEADLEGFRRVCSSILVNLGEPAGPSIRAVSGLFAKVEPSDQPDSGLA